MPIRSTVGYGGSGPPIISFLRGMPKARDERNMLFRSVSSVQRELRAVLAPVADNGSRRVSNSHCWNSGLRRID